MSSALSIQLPDELAIASTVIAKQMHISRSQFIRLAIENEINAFKLRQDQEKMASSFRALQHNPRYLIDIEDICDKETPLDTDEDEWWKS